MQTIEDKTFSKSGEASSWLSALKSKTHLDELLDSYPDGPIFRGDDVRRTLEFLQLCAAYESQIHIHDNEMDGAILTIDYEFGTMDPKQMELAFSFSHPEHEGTISFTLSVVKNIQSEFLVFGDRVFSQLV